jgi:hypothetical protein
MDRCQIDFGTAKEVHLPRIVVLLDDRRGIQCSDTPPLFCSGEHDHGHVSHDQNRQIKSLSFADWRRYWHAGEQQGDALISDLKARPQGGSPICAFNGTDQVTRLKSGQSLHQEATSPGLTPTWWPMFKYGFEKKPLISP